MKRTIISTSVYQKIPVTVNLNVKPLTFSEKVNGKFLKNNPVKRSNGSLVMNDEWIYVFSPNYGRIAINMNRANYCQKVYLSNVRILESIGNKKISKRLERFIENVSDKLVFEKNGITYRVYLKEVSKGLFDLSHVWPYWATVGTGGIMRSWENVIKKYGSHPGWDYKRNPDGSLGEHKLNVNLSIFGL